MSGNEHLVWSRQVSAMELEGCRRRDTPVA